MTTPQTIEVTWQFGRSLRRFVAIAVLWPFAVATSTACFFPLGTTFPPGASDDWSPLDNALVFASSMAISGPVAVIAVFAVGGKRRWVLDVVGAIMLLVAVFTAVVYTCLWLNPWLARSRMGTWEFIRLRSTMLDLSAATVRYNVPLGTIVGLILGTIVGLLAIIARRRPRVAIGLIAVLLLAGAAEPVQRLAFGLVLMCGYTVRWLIVSPGMTDPFVPAAGVSAGAIAGALIAAVALWQRRNRQSLEETMYRAPRPRSSDR